MKPWELSSQYILHIDSCRGCVNHLLSRTDEKNCWMKGLPHLTFIIFFWPMVHRDIFTHSGSIVQPHHATSCRLETITANITMVGRNRELSLSAIDSKWITMLVPISSLTRSSRELNQEKGYDDQQLIPEFCCGFILSPECNWQIKLFHFLFEGHMWLSNWLNPRSYLNFTTELTLHIHNPWMEKNKNT